MIRKYLLLLFVAAVPELHAQILSDTAAISLLKKGVDDIYGFRFSTARQAGKELSRAYPGHPCFFSITGCSPMVKPSSHTCEQVIRSVREGHD
jgi:hypothetical protein